MFVRGVERAAVRLACGQSDIGKRSFMGLIGRTTAAAALASVSPLEQTRDGYSQCIVSVELLSEGPLFANRSGLYRIKTQYAAHRDHGSAS